MTKVFVLKCRRTKRNVVALTNRAIMTKRSKIIKVSLPEVKCLSK